MKETEWMMRIWDWASENSIPNSVIPRSEDRLLQIKKLSIGLYPGPQFQNNGKVELNTKIKNIPKELGYLTNLQELEIRSGS